MDRHLVLTRTGGLTASQTITNRARMEGKTYPDRLTDRQTYRQTTTYIQTDGHTGRWTDRHGLKRTGGQMDRQTWTETDRQTDGQTDNNSNRPGHRWSERHVLKRTDIHTDRWTYGQMDRQTCTETDRPTDGQTESISYGAQIWTNWYQSAWTGVIRCLCICTSTLTMCVEFTLHTHLWGRYALYIIPYHIEVYMYSRELWFGLYIRLY